MYCKSQEPMVMAYLVDDHLGRTTGVVRDLLEEQQWYRSSIVQCEIVRLQCQKPAREKKAVLGSVG